ncbi:VaFE repeat-containing surface-anchored protein, partial [Peptoniphilaceae bacterium SGI.131]
DEDISGKFEGEKGVYVYKKDLDNKEGKLLTNPETGKLELRELDKGEYRVEEVKEPEGYFLNSNPQKIKLEREETLKFFNEKIPEIKTSAADKKDNNKDLEVNSDVTVTDKISYTNLIPGKEYTVKGKLMDKATNSPLLVNGKEVTAEKKFIAEAREGFIELDFTFNSKALEGKTLVAFEDLFREDRKIATHSDIEDEEQSIYIPKIQTSAWDKKDNDKQITLNEKVTIVDKVSYKNLIVGKEYTIKGVLIDKETGKPLILGNIKKNIDEIEKVESEKTFIAENKDGIIDLEFTFDSKNLEGKTLVVFEDLYREKKKIATHSDIEDKDQTV